MLIAADEIHLKSKIGDLMDAARQVELEAYMGKIKIMNNIVRGIMEADKYVEVQGSRIEIVKATKYLDWKLSVIDTH